MTTTIRKAHLKDTITFAINYIPQVDPQTLEAFLEMVYANGNYGDISHQQLLSKICLALKYIPNACANSLLILADLLGVATPIEADYTPTFIPPVISSTCKMTLLNLQRPSTQTQLVVK